MECLHGARNFAAMAVSSCHASRSGRRYIRKEAPFLAYGLCPPSLRVRAKAGSESCVTTVEQGFADEEDYIKGGGSELLFVHMQQNKPMEEQSKLSDKV